MEIRLKASKTLKFSTQAEADHQLQMISDKEDTGSVALLADPLCEEISLGTDINSDKISYLSCRGDSEESGHVLDFSWVQNLRSQCIALDIPFYFTGTGSNFRMKGRDFHIDKKFQESQAEKAEMNYFPLSRAMNPPVQESESDDLSKMGFRAVGTENNSSAKTSFRTASEDLKSLGFRSMNSSDSFNPFLEETASSNDSETGLKIPHINYDIEIEEDAENEFLPHDSDEETLTIPGINYEVTVEQAPPENAEQNGFDCSIEVTEQAETGSDAETLSQNFKGQGMDELFSHLQRSKFRSGFHLHKLERDYFTSHGEDVIRKHASDFIAQRLSPAEPANDGKQTPMKGHPVFIAQHATACCCRGCLKKWHHIPEHRALSDKEQNYIVDVIMAWIKRDIG